jgi:hypothetical protein
MEAAHEALRKKGLSAAAKKASRHAAQGLVSCMSLMDGATDCRGAGSIVMPQRVSCLSMLPVLGAPDLRTYA